MKSRSFILSLSRMKPKLPLFQHLLIVAIDALPALMPLLRFKAEGRDRPCVEPLHTDRLASFLAIAVRAVLDPHKRRVDFRNQLALPIPRAKFDAPVGFIARPVRDVGVMGRIL